MSTVLQSFDVCVVVKLLFLSYIFITYSYRCCVCVVVITSCDVDILMVLVLDIVLSWFVHCVIPLTVQVLFMHF